MSEQCIISPKSMTGFLRTPHLKAAGCCPTRWPDRKPPWDPPITATLLMSTSPAQHMHPSTHTSLVGPGRSAAWRIACIAWHQGCQKIVGTCQVRSKRDPQSGCVMTLPKLMTMIACLQQSANTVVCASTYLIPHAAFLHVDIAGACRKSLSIKFDRTLYIELKPTKSLLLYEQQQQAPTLAVAVSFSLHLPASVHA